MVKEPETRAETPVDIGREKDLDRAVTIRKHSQKTLEPPPKTSRTKKDPQDQIRSLKRISRLDMAENPEQANIQVILIYIVELKKP